MFGLGKQFHQRGIIELAHDDRAQPFGREPAIDRPPQVRVSAGEQQRRAIRANAGNAASTPLLTSGRKSDTGHSPSTCVCTLILEGNAGESDKHQSSAPRQAVPPGAQVYHPARQCWRAGTCGRSSPAYCHPAMGPRHPAIHAGSNPNWPWPGRPCTASTISLPR